MSQCALCRYTPGALSIDPRGGCTLWTEEGDITAPTPASALRWGRQHADQHTVKRHHITSMGVGQPDQRENGHVRPFLCTRSTPLLQAVPMLCLLCPPCVSCCPAAAWPFLIQPAASPSLQSCSPPAAAAAVRPFQLPVPIHLAPFSLTSLPHCCCRRALPLPGLPVPAGPLPLTSLLASLQPLPTPVAGSGPSSGGAGAGAGEPPQRPHLPQLSKPPFSGLSSWWLCKL